MDKLEIILWVTFVFGLILFIPGFTIRSERYGMILLVLGLIIALGSLIGQYIIYEPSSSRAPSPPPPPPDDEEGDDDDDEGSIDPEAPPTGGPLLDPNDPEYEGENQETFISGGRLAHGPF